MLTMAIAEENLKLGLVRWLKEQKAELKTESILIYF